MTGDAPGPSRRSHTKSRTGCKTCKRRHIRCDELFPQCRNCTRHQVRCDYLENIPSDPEDQSSSEEPHLQVNPDVELEIDPRQHTQSCTHSHLPVPPHPQLREYSESELHLIHHLSAISDDLVRKGTSHLTIWTQAIPKFLSIAFACPYVMHALLSFSANNVAWAQASKEPRNLSLYHGSVALRGLNDAIGSFSRANADAILAASLLLLGQATDWRSWSSLRAGIETVHSAMQSWRHESIFAEYLQEQALAASTLHAQRPRVAVTPAERLAILQSALSNLHRLQAALLGYEFETRWLDQLVAYLQHLRHPSPVQTAEQEFNKAYPLRKWLLWVPVQLFQQQGGQGPALLTVAYFYATALTLDPMFSLLGPSFCSAAALAPLEAIIDLTNALQVEHAMEQSSAEITSLMDYPRQSVLNHRHLVTRPKEAGTQPQEAFFANVSVESSTINGNINPAFAPTPLYYGPPQAMSNPSAPFLGVPLQVPFTYGLQTWGAIPSPGFPPQAD